MYSRHDLFLCGDYPIANGALALFIGFGGSNIIHAFKY
jgi:hypothetical protein